MSRAIGQLGERHDLILGVVQIRVAREAGLTLTERMMAG